MRQIALDIRPDEAPTLAGFVVGANAQAFERVAALALPTTFDALYLWGPPGSGRSHLLAGACAAANTRGRPAVLVPAAAVEDDLPLAPGGLLAVDDVERLSPAGQIALFRAWNSARLIGLALLVAGAEPPLRLALREDLRTRIGQSLVFELQPLSDADKRETLLRHAAARGLRLEHEVAEYLLRHGRRDLPSLLAVLVALDAACLEQKRAPTLPLLKDVLQRQIDLQPPA